MPIIETEVWKPNPDRPGTIIFDSQRAAQDIFNELETHLKADGRLPDEYFLFDAHGNWRNGALFPKDGEILCNVNYGGSEGIYLDISVKYKKDVYEYSQKNGELGWVNRFVIEHFATGKTLGDTIDDLDKMNFAASSVMAAFYGSKREIEERYAKINSGEVQPVYLSAEQRTAKVMEELAAEATNKIAIAINGNIKIGDWVIAAPSDVHGCLIGEVIGITPLGSPEHDTGNPSDDIHVNFMAFDYPIWRHNEIAEYFNEEFQYEEFLNYGEIPLNDVIMAPDNLIRITELGIDEVNRLIGSYETAEEFCNGYIHSQLISKEMNNNEN